MEVSLGMRLASLKAIPRYSSTRRIWGFRGVNVIVSTSCFYLLYLDFLFNFPLFCSALSHFSIIAFADTEVLRPESFVYVGYSDRVSREVCQAAPHTGAQQLLRQEHDTSCKEGCSRKTHVK